MPNAFLINESLESAIRSRVSRRLSSFGFTLKGWPKGKLKDDAGPGDVAVFVITSTVCSAEELRRFQDAVNSGVPIISIYMDELLGAPDVVGDYSSSTLNVDSEELGDALDRGKTVYKSAGGRDTEKTPIKHNKCK
jgi:hypothetical protein